MVQLSTLDKVTHPTRAYSSFHSMLLLVVLHPNLM